MLTFDIVFTHYSWDTTTLLDGNNYVIMVIINDGFQETYDYSDDLFSINNNGISETSSESIIPTLESTSGFSFLVVLSLILPLVFITRKNRRII